MKNPEKKKMTDDESVDYGKREQSSPQLPRPKDDEEGGGATGREEEANEEERKTPQPDAARTRATCPRFLPTQGRGLED